MASRRAQRIVLAAAAAAAAAVLGVAGHQGYLERCYHALRLRAAADYFETLLPAGEGTEADRALTAWLRTPAGRARAIEAFVEWLAGDFEPHWKRSGWTFDQLRIGVAGACDLGLTGEELGADRYICGFRWNESPKTELGNLPMRPQAIALGRRLGSLCGPPVTIERYPGHEFEVMPLEEAEKRYSTYPPDPNALIVFDAWVRPQILVIRRRGSTER